MAIDEIIRDVSDNIYAITIVLAAVAWIVKLALNQNKKYIENTVSDARIKICNDLNNMKTIIDRHERWFEEFFSRYTKGFKDVRYRESVRHARKGETDEYS